MKSRIKTAFTQECIIVRALITYCFSSIAIILIYGNDFLTKSFISEINIFLAGAILAGTFLILSALDVLLADKLNIKTLGKILLTALTMLFFIMIASYTGKFYIYLASLPFLAALTRYIIPEENAGLKLLTYIKKNHVIFIYAILGIGFFLFVGLYTAARYWTFKSPCFDFGIWAQMFHNMKTTGLPVTTCERYRELSHFAVHFSPIYYLMLPVYFIFPDPATLQFLQAAVIASGLIPVYLLARHFKLSNTLTLIAGVCFVALPAMSTGCSYDLHENCFLVPLLLWLLYFVEKNKFVPMLVFSLLTCLVKEDAPVYVAFIAIYTIFASWNRDSHKLIRLKGFALLVLSLSYFFITIKLLAKYGEGAMFYRYENYAVDGSGSIVGLIKTAFANPAYIFSESLNEEKITFALTVLAPLAFVPLLNLDIFAYILIGPFLLINLMSNYQYQYSISFQYVFGVSAILIYLFIKNLSDFKRNFKRFIAVFSLFSCIVAFSFASLPYLNYLSPSSINKENISIVNAALDKIPRDSIVCSTTMFVAHLYDVDELYELKTDFDANIPDSMIGFDPSILPRNIKTGAIPSNKLYRIADYIVLDLRYESYNKDLLNFIEIDYELNTYEPGLVAVLRNPNSTKPQLGTVDSFDDLFKSSSASDDENL